MSNLILYTSGSTDEPKEVRHTSDNVKLMIKRSIAELQLTEHDVVLNVYSGSVIAYYAITAMPALEVGATLISMNFDPYQYIKLFKKYKPTVISLIPKMIEILQRTKGFRDLDMTCVRYMVTGSQNVPFEMVNMLLEKGVQTVGNWYGSTENPPPVFVAKNGCVFDFVARQGYDISFTNEGECVVNGFHTNDIFDLETNKFLKRKNAANNNTWKTQPTS